MYILVYTSMYYVCLSTYCYILVCTKFVSVHTSMYLVCFATHWSKILSSTKKYIQLLPKYILLISWHLDLNRIITVCTILYNWSRSWENRLFREVLSTYTVFICIYTSVQCITWALLWKVDYLRIMTSCTRRYIQWWCGLSPSKSVSYYSMVCTEITRGYCFHSSVHTIRCQEIKSM